MRKKMAKNGQNVEFFLSCVAATNSKNLKTNVLLKYVKTDKTHNLPQEPRRSQFSSQKLND